MSLLGSISALLIDKAIKDEFLKQRRFDIFKKLVGSLDTSLTDLTKGKISFYNTHGGLVAFANKQVLGSWDENTKEWQWSWGMPHGSINETLRQDAKLLFFNGVRNQWPLFVTPKFKASKHIMQVLCALSQQVVGAWHCVAYKKGHKYWYVLIKNMNYLDPLINLTIDQQLQGYNSSSRMSQNSQMNLALESETVRPSNTTRRTRRTRRSKSKSRARRRK
jgi:hypothetical protein